MPFIYDHQQRKNQPSQPEKQSPDPVYFRRALLKHMAVIGAAGVLAPGLIAGCRGENEPEPSAASGACADSDSLSLTQRANRRALSYVDQSPHPERTCDNCRLFKQGTDGAACGTCEVVSGPIAAAGYCNAWAA